MTDLPPCTVCGSRHSEFWTFAQDIEYGTTDQTYRYYRCTTCDCLFLHPVPIDQLSVIYPDSYYTDGSGKGLFSFLVKLKFHLDQRFFRRLLTKMDGQDLAILDVGGGSGALLTAVRASDQRVKRTVVVDLGANGADAARAAGHEFHNCLFEDFETETRFDVIFMMNLIEHVADPAAVLSKARDLLKPGGRVVVQTPNWRCAQERLFRRYSWAGYHCPRHWALWHRPGFERFARDLNFIVIKSEYVQGASFWATSIAARLTALGLRRARPGYPLHKRPIVGVLAAIFAAVDIPLSRLGRTGQMLFLLGPR